MENNDSINKIADLLIQINEKDEKIIKSFLNGAVSIYSNIFDNVDNFDYNTLFEQLLEEKFNISKTIISNETIISFQGRTLLFEVRFDGKDTVSFNMYPKLEMESVSFDDWRMHVKAYFTDLKYKEMCLLDLQKPVPKDKIRKIRQEMQQINDI